MVIAYDGSAGAAAAVRSAASLFPTADASVVTVPREVTAPPATAVPVLPTMSPTLMQQAIDQLMTEAQEQAAETGQAGVDHARAHGLNAEVAPAAAPGPVWATVLETAHRLGADVLVCGTRGRGGFARVLLGSTSSGLLHHTDVPLLVVPDAIGTLDGPVVAAYDGSKESAHAIAVVGRLLPGRTVVVIHASESEFHRSLAARALARGPVDDLRELVALLEQTLTERAEATTQQGVGLAGVAGLEAQGDTVQSTAGVWRAVAAAARTHEAAVIAAGSRGLGQAGSALLGSVSSGLAQNADLPILVVPSAALAAE